MSRLVLAIGLVLSLEGLVIALAPGRVEEIMALLARLPVDARRLIGLVAMAAGVVLIWLAGGPAG